jgi:WD40 repeat protein
MLNQNSRIYAGITVIVAILLLLYATLRPFLEQSIAARVAQPCIMTPEGWSCYGQPDLLTQAATTATAVSPDGQQFVSTSRRTIQVWNLRTNQLQNSWTAHQDWITALAVSPDGQTLASASLDQTIKLWSLETGNLLDILKTERVTCLKFSPDGETLASGSRTLLWPDNAVSLAGVQLWDVSTRTFSQRLGKGSVNAIAFSPDGKLLAMGDQNVQIWQLNSKSRQLHTLSSGKVTALTFTPDSQELVSGSSKVKLWQVRSGKLMRLINSSATDLVLSADGKTMATASGGTVNLWRFPTKKLLTTLRGSWYSGLFVNFGLNDQALIASSSDGIRVWQLKRSRRQDANHWNARQRTELRASED